MTMTAVGSGKVGQFWKSCTEAPRSFFRIGKNDFEFVDYWPDKECIRVWLNTTQLGDHSDSLVLLPIAKIPADVLKDLPVWDTFSKEVQEDLSKRAATLELIEQQEVVDRMNHARRHRKGNPEYAGIPRELVCTKCECRENATVQKVPPAMVIKYAKRDGKTVEEYVKTWECSKCSPRRRGKAPSAKWAKFPRELICQKCSHIQKQHPSMTEKQIVASGKKFQDFIENWLCMKCRPEGDKRRGKRKVDPISGVIGHRGRVANPEFVGLPKFMTCSCGNKVNTNAHQLKIKALAQGTTILELIKNYKCQVCSPSKKGRHKK